MDDRAGMLRLRECRVIELNKVIEQERARMEREIKCMNSRLLARAVQGERNKIVQGTKRELCCFGRRMEELLGMCKQRTRAEDGRFSQASTREHDQLYKQWYNWLRFSRGSAADLGRAGGCGGTRRVGRNSEGCSRN